MCKGISQTDLASFSELAAGGIPLDEEVVGSLKASGGGLSIYQSLTSFESYVTNLEFGGTGYVLSLEIYNGSDRIVWPCAYRLTPLANEREFRWLEIASPRVEGEPPYQFPGETSGGFGDAEVLNHRLGRKYRLYPGDSLDGFLLGAGQQPLLPEYRNGQLLDVTLSIFDQRDIRYEANMQLMVDRKPPVKQHRSKRNQPSLGDLFREARERESRQLREVA